MLIDDFNDRMSLFDLEIVHLCLPLCTAVTRIQTHKHVGNLYIDMNDNTMLGFM